MKHISSQELRKARNNFWESKKHIYLPEASLVGGKESTAMFTIAGMQQLIPYLSGKKHPLGKRLYNIQKCVRTVDSFIRWVKTNEIIVSPKSTSVRPTGFSKVSTVKSRGNMKDFACCVPLFWFFIVDVLLLHNISSLDSYCYSEKSCYWPLQAQSIDSSIIISISEIVGRQRVQRLS